MAGKVKFYRGAQGTSLPETRQDGAISIIERNARLNGYSLGDMYVDMDNGKRLHIVPDNGYQIYDPTTMVSQVSRPGAVYVIVDNNNNQIGVKIGDSTGAYIGDLPIYSAVSLDEKAFWSQKVNAYLGTEYADDEVLSDAQRAADGLTLPNNDLDETLVLSRELWF